MGFAGFAAALVAVIILMIVPLVGVWAAHLDTLFGVVVPYLAVAIFFIGLIYRIVQWGKSPVPFRIPTTSGQEKSLDWIKPDWLDNPMTKGQVVARMALEVLAFRSLFRNTALDFRNGRAYYSSSKWLWLFAIAFHYAFLVVLIRHMRFFVEPTPFWIGWLESLDGFMQVGLYPFSWLPVMFISGMVLLGAATLLVLRRIFLPNIRYISMSNDWFPLFLIIHIAATGVLMRYLLKVDITSVKELTLSLARFNPTVPEDIGVLFYIHLFLVSVLFAYFPFSKLMHAPGVFLSPTRNLPNDSRIKRHINPWNPEVEKHTYEEYEDDFREFMVEADLPVEKPLEESPEEKPAEE